MLAYSKWTQSSLAGPSQACLLVPLLQSIPLLCLILHSSTSLTLKVNFFYAICNVSVSSQFTVLDDALLFIDCNLLQLDGGVETDHWKMLKIGCRQNTYCGGKWQKYLNVTSAPLMEQTSEIINQFLLFLALLVYLFFIYFVLL